MVSTQPESTSQPAHAVPAHRVRAGTPCLMAAGLHHTADVDRSPHAEMR